MPAMADVIKLALCEPVMVDVIELASSCVQLTTLSTALSMFTSLQRQTQPIAKHNVATLQSLSNSRTFADISSEYLRSINPRNSSDTKRNACYFSLQYSYILSQL